MTAFSLTEDAKGKSLAIFYDNGDTVTIPESHVAFDPIVELWFKGEADDDSIRALANPLVELARKMSQLSERVSADSQNVYFDGDPIRGELADVIKDLFLQGKVGDVAPLVNFLEKAKTNPGLASIDQLYKWIANGDLVITPSGDIIAYKGVETYDGVDYSIHSGTAWVNGEEIKGQIPYRKGSVVTMPRAEVDSNNQITCSQGLHVGTYEYASGFGSKTLLIQFNPRDVVAVPPDHNNAKIRVCRLVVLGDTQSRLPERVYSGNTVEEGPETLEVDGSIDSSTIETNSGRDSKGRFTKDTAKKAVRDSKGRFVRLV